MLDQVW